MFLDCLIRKILCYYDNINDVFIACWNSRWNPCGQCFSFNVDAVFWGQKGSGIKRWFPI